MFEDNKINFEGFLIENEKERSRYRDLFWLKHFNWNKKLPYERLYFSLPGNPRFKKTSKMFGAYKWCIFISTLDNQEATDKLKSKIRCLFPSLIILFSFCNCIPGENISITEGLFYVTDLFQLQTEL